MHFSSTSNPGQSRLPVTNTQLINVKQKSLTSRKYIQTNVFQETDAIDVALETYYSN